MLEAIIVAWFLSILGFTVAPFATVASGASVIDAAIIAGVFSVINVVLTAWLNAATLRAARENRREIRAARQASYESAEELRDVKRKVHGERRNSPAKPKPGGRRKGVDP